MDINEEMIVMNEAIGMYDRSISGLNIELAEVKAQRLGMVTRRRHLKDKISEAVDMMETVRAIQEPFRMSISDDQYGPGWWDEEFDVDTNGLDQYGYDEPPDTAHGRPAAQRGGGQSPSDAMYSEFEGIPRKGSYQSVES
jgi:hypothetical protein